MSQIHIKKGLDIPIEGEPEGQVQELEANGRKIVPTHVALNVSCFDEIKFKLLVKQGETVKVGQPLLLDKECPERVFTSPAGGVISDVERGLKRRLLNVVIEVAENEQWHELPKLDPSSASREQLTKRLLDGGLFAHIWKRPFKRLPNPHRAPRAIFVKVIESAPFVPSAEMQVEGHEEDFQRGLDALAKLTDGPVHLVYREGSNSAAFTGAQNVETHTALGPHPIGTHSLHIHKISPIQSADESVWTVNVLDVIAIGHHLRTGRPQLERVISIAGPAVLPEKRGYFRVRAGMPVENLISGRVEKGAVRFISGDVLTGEKVEASQFLGFFNTAFSVLEENTKREFLHFFRLGLDKFTASRTYFSGLFKKSDRTYDFTTNQHGEKRAFVIGSPYDKVMPMRIPTMQLVKSVLAEDYDLAEELGIFEVDSEDFALATFVCPSKMEMVDIMKNGLQAYAKEVLE